MFISVNASHNIGGSIEYTHKSDKKYEATITTYTNFFASTERDTLLLDWGDNTIDTVIRDTSIFITEKLRKNLYTSMHEYEKEGKYKLVMQDPNRGDNINNIDVSEDEFFYLEAELKVSSGGSNNSSVLVSPFKEMVAVKDTRFSFDFNHYDPDRDRLFYELVDTKSKNGNVANNYKKPLNAVIGKNSGLFQWTPSEVGKYTFTVKISECRFGELVGSKLVDITFEVEDSLNTEGFFSLSGNALEKENEIYEMNLSNEDTLGLDITFGDISGDSSVNLELYGESLNDEFNYAISTLSSSTDTVVKNYTWYISDTISRCTPFHVTFRGESHISGNLVTKDVTLLINVQNEFEEGCNLCETKFTLEDTLSEEGASVIVGPNPFKETTVFYILGKGKNEKYTLYLYNRAGELVLKSSNSKNGKFRLFGDNLIPGIYLYRVTSNNTTIGTGKVVRL